MSDHVCDDLINDIFERLPPKSLLRFRSLSKAWCARIQSPDFISRHALRSKKKTPKILIRHQFIDVKKDKRMIMYVNGEPESRKREDDMYTLHSEEQFVSSNPEWLDVSIPAVKFPTIMGDTPIGNIVGSCNGILCLFHDTYDTISLWNPSIRHVTTLPPAPHHPNCASIVGFGFDPSIDDYKIVRISLESSFVYTLKTGAWCPIASPPATFTNKVLYYKETCACFFNGALHWVVTEHYTKYILTFDITTHVFGKILLRNPIWRTRQLITINGSLALIHVNTGENSDRLKSLLNGIWILKEYNNKPFWSDAYKFGEFGPQIYPSQGAKCVLQLTTNGHLLLNFGHTPNIEYSDMYGVYNPETRKFDPSMIMRFQDSQHIDMEKYVETLELLDTKLGQKKMDEMIASHSVTVLRRSEMPQYFS